MNNPKLLDFLKRRCACKEGLVYLRAQQSPGAAWKDCKRGDWMMYFAQQRDVDIKLMTAVKVKQVRLVQHLMTDQRSLDALDVAEKFSRGEVSEETLKLAAAATANYATYATAATAAAAFAAAAAAAFAAAATYAADAADVRSEILVQCADICREMIPIELLKLEEFEGGL